MNEGLTATRRTRWMSNVNGRNVKERRVRNGRTEKNTDESMRIGRRVKE